MGFIARNLTTNEVHYSKGANKLAHLIGCNYSTITKHYQKTKIDKVVKDYLVSITIDLNNNDRGTNIKSMFNANKTY